MGLRPQLDSRLRGHSARRIRRQVEAPKIDVARDRGCVVEKSAVGREDGVEIDGRCVDHRGLTFRSEVEQHDRGFVVSHKRDAITARRPRGARVQRAPAGDARRDTGLESQEPDPTARRERDHAAVGRGCRIDRAHGKRRKLVSLEIDVMAVAIDLGVAVGPLRR